jgi:hypothetical protein
MKNKLSIILLLSLSVFAGCAKGGADSPRVDEEPLLFTGSTVSTKATFSDEDDGTLVWSSYDNLGVYSFDTGSSALVHSGFAPISWRTGNDAVFASSEGRSAWAGSATNIKFSAYYPQMFAPESSCVDGRVALNLPNAQSGEFGKYQICYASTSLTAAALTEGYEPVNFEFAPATSMLRVKPVLKSTSAVDAIYIKQLTIQIADNRAIAGSCELALSNGSLSAVSGSSTVTVTLTNAVRITKDENRNPFFTAILLPAATGNSILSFYVVDENGTKYTMANKLSPVRFLPGARYSLEREFLVSVVNGDTPDAYYIDGGNGWDYEPVVEDGAYTNAGFGW